MPPFLHYDAHCHWQDSRLLPHRTQIQRDLDAAGVARAVANGTSPQDWQQVAELALADSRVLPAFGLHPWHVNAVCKKQASMDTRTASEPATTADRHLPPASESAATASHHLSPTRDSANWLDILKTYLKKFPQAAVGEIGLDNWIKSANKPLQREAFLAQLALATKDNRPVSIHCLRADSDLLDALKAADGVPSRGIHLHGFAGSIETARQLLDFGAYFSFSEYIATPKRVKARALAAYIPLDRLLAETDAPDMMGPPEWQHYNLRAEAQEAHPSASTARAVNSSTQNTSAATESDAVPIAAREPRTPAPKHPANITAAYAYLAQLRNIPLEELATAIEGNFLRYFNR